MFWKSSNALKGCQSWHLSSHLSSRPCEWRVKIQVGKVLHKDMSSTSRSAIVIMTSWPLARKVPDRSLWPNTVCIAPLLPSTHHIQRFSASKPPCLRAKGSACVTLKFQQILLYVLERVAPITQPIHREMAIRCQLSLLGPRIPHYYCKGSCLYQKARTKRVPTSTSE